MKVARLSVTPIKGTQLQDRSFIDLDTGGVADDRRFYFIDARGSMFNGKKEGRLVRLAADYDRHSERLMLHFPDGKEVAQVWTAGEAVTTNFYGRPVGGHAALGPWSAAVSEFIRQPVRLIAVDRLGDAVDVHPVTVVSQASIESLRRSTPGAQRLDHRRFRMLVELEGVDPHEEDAWSGRHMRLGSAVVEIVGPVPRCIVTSQDPVIGETDFDTLKAIMSYRGAVARELQTPAAHLPGGGKIVFGVYGQVVEPGRISLGDGVTPA